MIQALLRRYMLGVCISGAIAYVLLNTRFIPAFSEYTLNRIPMGITLSEVRGSLLKGQASISIVRADGSNWILDQGQWDIRFWKSFYHRAIYIESLEAKHLTGYIEPRSSSWAAFFIPSIQIKHCTLDDLYLGLGRNAIHLEHFAFESNNTGGTIEATIHPWMSHIRAHFTLDDNQVRIDSIHDTLNQMSLEGTGLFTTTTDGMDATLSLHFRDSKEDKLYLEWDHAKHKLIWDLAASDLSFIEPLEGTIVSHGDLSIDKVEGMIDMHVSNKTSANPPFQLSSTLSGTPDKHILNIESSYTSHRLHTRLTGHLETNDGTWRGTLDDVTLEGSQTLSLQSPSTIQYHLSDQQFSLDNPICLSNSTQSKLCLTEQALTWEHLALPDPHNAWFGWTLKGTTSGTFTPSQLNIEGEALLLEHDHGAIDDLSFQNAKLQVHFQTKNLAFHADIAPVGTLDLEANVDGADWLHGNLHGILNLDLKQINKARMIQETIWVDGNIQAKLQLSGSLQTPHFHGTGLITKLNIPISEYGALITIDTVECLGDPSGQLALSGTGHMGKGNLSIKGLVRPFPYPEASLHVTGHTLQLANTPLYKVIGSPDLNMHFKDHQLQLDGNVTIDEAEIISKKQEFKRGTADVIIHNGATIEESSHEHLQNILGNVTIDFGNKTSYQGYGLSTFVTGKLTIHHQPGQVAIGDGQLKLVNGKYKKLGQEFSLTKGLLHFSHTPISNPIIDIQAMRQMVQKKRSYDYTPLIAGLNIYGPIQAPRLKLFSNPPLQEDEILSYLILGVPPDKNNKASNQALMQVAKQMVNYLGFNGAQNNIFPLGIMQPDEIGLSTRESGPLPLSSSKRGSAYGLDDTEFFLGKKLSNDLYFYYSIGIADSLNTIRLRYLMGDYFTFEVTSKSQGQGNGADVLFTLDK